MTFAGLVRVGLQFVWYFWRNVRLALGPLSITTVQLLTALEARPWSYQPITADSTLAPGKRARGTNGRDGHRSEGHRDLQRAWMVVVGTVLFRQKTRRGALIEGSKTPVTRWTIPKNWLPRTYGGRVDGCNLGNVFADVAPFRSWGL